MAVYAQPAGRTSTVKSHSRVSPRRDSPRPSVDAARRWRHGSMPAAAAAAGRSPGCSSCTATLLAPPPTLRHLGSRPPVTWPPGRSRMAGRTGRRSPASTVWSRAPTRWLRRPGCGSCSRGATRSTLGWRWRRRSRSSSPSCRGWAAGAGCRWCTRQAATTWRWTTAARSRRRPSRSCSRCSRRGSASSRRWCRGRRPAGWRCSGATAAAWSGRPKSSPRPSSWRPAASR
eukprot:SAG22_NODE_96_length_20771_cov_33.186018_11_plen_230_part_00